MKIMNLLFSLALVTSLTGCAGLAKRWKALISDDDGKVATEQGALQRKSEQTYSAQPQLTPPVYRKYSRMTKKDFEDQANVDARAGSLWVVEGQGSYLFAQNVVRMIGDPVGITLEGEPRAQLAKKQKSSPIF